MQNQNTGIHMAQGITVHDLEMLKKYFDFEHLYKISHEDPIQIQWFLDSLDTNEKIGVGAHLGPLLKYFNMPERYIEVLIEGVKNPRSGEYPWWTYQDGKAVLKEDMFIDHMSMIYQLDTRFHKTDQYGRSTAEPKEGFPDFREYGRRLRKPVQRLAQNGKRQFTGKAALEFTLLFYLHLQAGKTEIPEAAVDFIEQEIESDGGIDMDFAPLHEEDNGADTASSELVIPKDIDEWELPFYTGETGQNDSLALVRITNPSKRTKRVRFQDTVMKRAIPQNDVLWAVRKGNLFVSFLPRFVISDETVVHSENGKITFETKEEETYSLDFLQDPVCWADSNCYGTFLVNEHGELETGKLYEKIPLPEKPVIGVAATAVDYCLLLNDGSTLCGIQKKGWGNLLSFAITLNGGLAITAERRVIDGSGSRLAGENIVSVDCYENHYLCIDSKGRIYTDSHLTLDSGVAVMAGAVYEKGYILSMDHKIQVYDFNNHLIKSTEMTVEVTELYADGETAAYYDDTIGYFEFYEI